MASRTVPERITWAVDQIQVAPGQRILEIGCGRGVAISLICDRLETGLVSGIDRSSTAVEAASALNARHLASGLATLRTVSLEDLQPPGLAFDTVFAVNVNLFWVRPPGQELEKIRRMLAPGGTLHLIYEPPSGDKARSTAETTETALEQAGYAVTTCTATARSGATLLCLTGRPR
ncbi:class I SAM-dependent methyltransferase [Phytoactinopolyspora alkaliphila]|uniref:Class I SAM-dependent methyltransferase n=1 Tax=Phytoactinopolyspora alkaliphila TaxID=1783498 RepID=A0A6N9YRS4_9ACTN|nr:class I SAM-dependent methyltransferase [Phytoactinopolyspora alkaliphila]NED97640.1 class I SAM-dependent methyltransferase [Phytoactinopolyspora alkaliphila]